MGAIAYLPQYKIEDFLKWEGDWELWNGVPVSMSPSPRWEHQEAGANLVTELNIALRTEGCDGCRVAYETDWHVCEDTVVCPDVVVVCFEPTGGVLDKPPTLVSEFLSPATREKDLTAKRDLYAQQAVPFYIIGDVDKKELTLLRLDGDTYRESEDWGLEFHEGCRVQIDPGKVFRTSA